ncbi:MAG TPA: hypothetical protein VGB52_01860 [Actinomycetota bacterium]
MIPGEVLASSHALYPDAGTLRVHPAPEALAPAEPDRPGRSRFDDPEGLVAVRYTATRLIACLLETMSRFRRQAEAEAILADIEGLEEDDLEWPADDAQALTEWLDIQRVGTVRVLATGVFLDVEAPALLVQLDKHPRVRDAVAALDAAAHLDVALMRLGGIELGRPISQAVGVAVREWIPDALGVGYHSRFATDEPCWAVWETTAVAVESVHLNPSDPQHRAAVQSAAATFELTLPAQWQ